MEMGGKKGYKFWRINMAHKCPGHFSYCNNMKVLNCGLDGSLLSHVASSLLLETHAAQFLLYTFSIPLPLVIVRAKRALDICL